MKTLSPTGLATALATALETALERALKTTSDVSPGDDSSGTSSDTGSYHGSGDDYGDVSSDISGGACGSGSGDRSTNGQKRRLDPRQGRLYAKIGSSTPRNPERAWLEDRLSGSGLMSVLISDSDVGQCTSSWGPFYFYLRGG